MAGIIGGCAVVNSGLSALQQLVIGKKIAGTELAAPPVFIIGHWRSGTTLLHEYLVRDARHTYPDTYMCFCPNHFLASWTTLRPLTGLLLPKKRPMDNMAVGWDRPQEDEFAICNMSLPSPYLSMIFPNRPPMDTEYLDMEGVPEADLACWKSRFEWFLKAITYHDAKRVVLKSPPHTARIRTLLEMFPDAKFIHIHRDPYVLFPSTVNLWMRLSKDQGLQSPKGVGMEEYVFETFERMYAAYQRDREMLGPDQLVDIAYDELVGDPIGHLERIYKTLDLGDFETARPDLEEFAATQKEYRRNQYEISDEIQAEIERRWSWYFDEYGYSRR